ncbi:MAG: fatty acyl-AMP ligase [Desulfobacteraceae bacterium]|nr:fatty acyl-AMP ligase [Desulfobacteraceae bacterium]
MHDQTLCTLIQRAAEMGNRGYRFLDYRENETYVGYDALFKKSLGVAGFFSHMGIKPGDKVALILPTGPEFFYAFFGTLFCGGVPVPLYPPVRLGRMEEYHQKTGRMLEISEARLVCTDKRIKRILGRCLEIAGPDLGCITLNGIAPEPFELAMNDPDTPALIQFSSGTTFDPKPVLLTHRQIVANIQTMLDYGLNYYGDTTEGSSYCGLSWLPLYHDMGLIGCAMLAIAQPADLVLIPPELFVTRPAVWLRAISAYKPIISGAPNFAFSLCTKKIKDKEIEGVDLSSWQVALIGGETVSASALEKFIKRFAPYGFSPHALTPVYGLAEASLGVTFSDLKQPFVCNHFNREQLLKGQAKNDTCGDPVISLGKPLPGFQVEIRDKTGAKTDDSTIGSVYIKGPSIMKEYYNNPSATADAMRDGWLDTGDNGFIFKEDLYLYGRKKDLIIIRGQNYSPQMIEMALANFPGIRIGCVAATGYVPENDENERLIVFIERDKRGARTDDKKLADSASKKITESTGLVPESVIVLAPGTIFRTSSGKFRRGETLKQYIAGTLAPPGQVTILRMSAEMIKSKIATARMNRNIRKARQGSAAFERL